MPTRSLRRRDFATLVTGAAVALPFPAPAQNLSKVARIGFLSTGRPFAENSPQGAPLIRGFAQHGYLPDKNLAFEPRGAELHVDRLPQLVADLVARKVDVIIASGYQAALAAKQGTALPVVINLAGDPVGTGLVDG